MHILGKDLVQIYKIKNIYSMELYDVQVTTDAGETLVLQISANDPQEAETTAISMVEMGQANTVGRAVVDCFAL